MATRERRQGNEREKMEAELILGLPGSQGMKRVFVAKEHSVEGQSFVIDLSIFARTGNHATRT